MNIVPHFQDSVRGLDELRLAGADDALFDKMLDTSTAEDELGHLVILEHVQEVTGNAFKEPIIIIIITRRTAAALWAPRCYHMQNLRGVDVMAARSERMILCENVREASSAVVRRDLVARKEPRVVVVPAAVDQLENAHRCGVISNGIDGDAQHRLGLAAASGAVVATHGGVAREPSEVEGDAAVHDSADNALQKRQSQLQGAQRGTAYESNALQLTCIVSVFDINSRTRTLHLVARRLRGHVQRVREDRRGRTHRHIGLHRRGRASVGRRLRNERRPSAFPFHRIIPSLLCDGIDKHSKVLVHERHLVPQVRQEVDDGRCHRGRGDAVVNNVVAWGLHHIADAG
eukprot:PhM_4_TR8247/c0_g1_i1/m.102158